LAYAYHYYQRWSERQSAMSACESSYQEGDHESVVAACLELSEKGVADAVNVLNRSRQRESEREVAEKEAERLAREEAEKEEAERLAREAAEKERAKRPKAGRVFRDCDVCPEMVVIPPGSFMMGSPPSEENRGDDEGPVHQVNIAYSFAVGVHEVTRGEYSHFVSATGYQPGPCQVLDQGEMKDKPGSGWQQPGFPQSDSHPVVCVSWDGAHAYIRWLSRKTGESYRLLSESEWEYAARAGTTTARYWGESESGQCRYANGADMTAKRQYDKWTVVSCEDGFAQTSPAAHYEANAFGLYDVLGNVWEWTQDCWNDNYQGAPNDGGAWQSGDCSRRVLRGGSWYVAPGDLRSAYRSGVTAGLRLNVSGFRVARTLTP